ncbi:molybdenum ABC transporter ATP-binding protein [Spiribacter pallidus]|jgi:molybdate transport system ATP-binding protein|uniref:Molybdenum ABC transporter ATP-binding protein n=1 Tax=Spiribacter pallidus TaxID=1987936 RepID=A0ABV3TEW8_9GAMM
MNIPPVEFDLALQRDGFALKAAGVVPTGVTAVFGRSGCGKTTLLRCLAGFEAGCTGQIRHGDVVWQSARVRQPAHRRRVGMVFQDARLFAHLSVRQNLGYAYKRRRGRGPDWHEVVAALGVEGLLDRWPAALSGGEAQRVALARALLTGPALLLLDEPLAALDYGRRREILPLIAGIPERFSIPVVYVTHSRYEVLELADRVMLMERGNIQAAGSVSEVFSNPDHWSLLGNMAPTVIWDAQVVARDNDWGLTILATDAGRLRLGGLDVRPGQSLRLRLTARDVVLVPGQPAVSSLLNTLSVQVDEINDYPRGVVHVRLRAGSGAVLWAEITRQAAAGLRLASGRRLYALIRPQVLRINH